MSRINSCTQQGLYLQWLVIGSGLLKTPQRIPTYPLLLPLSLLFFPSLECGLVCHKSCSKKSLSFSHRLCPSSLPSSQSGGSSQDVKTPKAHDDAAVVGDLPVPFLLLLLLLEKFLVACPPLILIPMRPISSLSTL